MIFARGEVHQQSTRSPNSKDICCWTKNILDFYPFDPCCLIPKPFLATFLNALFYSCSSSAVYAWANPIKLRQARPRGPWNNLDTVITLGDILTIVLAVAVFLRMMLQSYPSTFGIICPPSHSYSLIENQVIFMKGTTPLKKMFAFGHCSKKRGGEALARFPNPLFFWKWVREPG